MAEREKVWVRALARKRSRSSRGGGVGSQVAAQAVEAAGDIPVLAAGGIGSGEQMVGAMAMGWAGVWTGSIWLAVEEAHAEPAQKASYFKATSEDTVRTRSWTGKTARVLRNDWTEAWDRADTPDPLGMPLQGLVTSDAMRRTTTYAGVADTQAVGFNPVGQVVGQINGVERVRHLMARLLSGYADALARLNSLMPS